MQDIIHFILRLFIAVIVEHQLKTCNFYGNLFPKRNNNWGG